MGSTEVTSIPKKLSESNDIGDTYGPNLKTLPCNNQVKELQTILRDKNTTRSDFKFYADRLIRLVIEESLNQLPFSKCVVTTPTGAKYNGLKYQKGNCGVSIIRSGEAMEQGLRDCCRSIRIGTGNTVIKAMAVLKEHNVLEENIILSNLFCTPVAAKSLVTAFPQMKILTSEIHSVAPNHFGQKYFGCSRFIVRETTNVQGKDI
nr:PREDICTED: uracil phosphoribosyltransferase homolog isoform X3 [Megachile rotundata]